MSIDPLGPVERRVNNAEHTLRRRTAAPIAIALVTMTILAGCAAPQSDPPPPDGIGLEHFLAQKLAFAPCDPAIAGVGTEGTECAMLEVPLDYANPDGRTIELGVGRVASTRGTDRLGSIVVNPGGPGGSGVQFAPVLAAAWADHEDLARYDVVGFDLRGSGMSEPAMGCYTDEQLGGDAITTALPPAGTSWSTDSASEVLAACSSSVGGQDALAQFGTRNIARDMDVLRAVLGEDKLTYLGVSYGTRLGAIYAETFPAKVGALVLDGAIDPRKPDIERQAQLYGGLQRSFEQLAAFCAAQGDCPFGDDPSQATTVAQSLMQPLIDAPLPTADGRELTFYGAVQALTLGLYAESAWPTVIEGFRQFREGNGEVLLYLRDVTSGRLEDGSYTSSAVAGFAINCIDEQRMSGAETTALLNEVTALAPFTDPGVAVQTEFGCAGWPEKGTLDFPYATDIEGLPETLVTSVTGDGLTPHEGGIALAEALGARLLTVEGEDHGAVISDTPCVNDVIADYLVNGRLPAAGSTCEL